MRLLLTGATGFVGRNVLLQALREGRYTEIVVPVRSREKLRAQCLGDGFDDIPSAVRPVVAAAPEWKMDGVGAVDHVIHAAGVLFAQSYEEYRRTNVDGTLSLLRALPGRPKVVILSSQAAAGPCSGGTALTETDGESPLTWYGQSKLEMERRVREEFPDLDYLCLRPPMVLGPRDQATLPLFKMVRGPIHFKPGLRRKHYSFISVGDLVRALFAALDAPDAWADLPQRHFFVAAGEPVTDTDLLAGAAAASGRKGLVVAIPQPLLRGLSRVVDSVPQWRASIPNLSADRAREIWPDRWVVCPSAFERRFRWKAVDALAPTLAATRDWYVKTGQLRA